MLRELLLSARRHATTFFPPACAGCDGVSTADDAFCSVCAPVAHPIITPFCRRCAVPMDLMTTRVDTPSQCSRCEQSPPIFDKVYARWEYDGAVADAIRRIKYGADLPALRSLCRGAGPWFSRKLADFEPQIPLIPVPAHPVDLRSRGFHLPSLVINLLPTGNQKILATRLQKYRSTASQASLNFEERRKNLVDAFCWRGPPPQSKTAFLVDDVLTTGATADAASRALKSAGFESVHIFVLARAPFISGSQPPL